MDRLVGSRLVAMRKVIEYLLDEHHPTGRAKAAYFTRFGFTAEGAETFLLALHSHPEHNAVIKTELGPFGVKHIVECSIRTPDARNPCIRTVWLLERGTTIHRLITAYPV